MPILIADERAPGDTIISLNATVFEFNPFEMGSFDPTTYGFAPMRYIGSNFSQGFLPKTQGCVAGFDNLGFVMGTSSSLFNQFLTHQNVIKGLPDSLRSALADIITDLGKEENDIADYSPNPFLGFHNATNRNAHSKRLTLVDGGEDHQNIPLNPVIQPMRQTDVVFAIDSSADTKAPSAPNFPNGTAIIATYQRANTDIMNQTSFPYVPGQDTFVALGLNQRPTFFGCNSSNVTRGSNVPPLIVYLPNSPYSFQSNQSTFDKLDYTIEERNAMIRNGYNVVTQGNSTRQGASDWPTCVGCAILSRSLERNGQAIPEVCSQCFDEYCWNGTMVTSSPPYLPKQILTFADQRSGVGKSFNLKLSSVMSVLALLGLLT
jgi:lysophospholipase